MLAAACGGTSDDGAADADDGGLGEASETDGGADESVDDGAEPADPWPGAYELTTWLEAYPMFPRGGALPAAGECFEDLADLMGDPGSGLARRMIAIAEDRTGTALPAAVRATIEATVESVLCDCHVAWCADPAAARSPFLGVAVGLPLTGMLTINDGPDTAGVLAEGQLHEYAAVVLPQSLPCNGAASPACVPQLFPLAELLDWPAYLGDGTWTGRADIGGLTVDSHALPLPVGRILRAAIERHLLGAVLGDPTLRGWDAVFDAWLPRCVIRAFNAGVPAGERLAEDGGCNAAGEAWGSLVSPDDVMTADIVGPAFAATCLERHDDGATCLATFDDVARDGVTFAAAGTCPAPDDDGDGLVDGFGLAEPCPWTVTWRDATGERTGNGRFTAGRLVR